MVDQIDGAVYLFSDQCCPIAEKFEQEHEIAILDLSLIEDVVAAGNVSPGNWVECDPFCRNYDR